MKNMYMKLLHGVCGKRWRFNLLGDFSWEVIYLLAWRIAGLSCWLRRIAGLSSGIYNILCTHDV